MDPVNAVGVAAGAIQFADVSFRALIGMIKVLKRLKETPQRMIELLQDVEKSVQQIHALQNAIQPPNSLSTHLSATQIQRVRATVDDAYQATNDLQTVLDPLSERLTPLGMAGPRRRGGLQSRSQRRLRLRLQRGFPGLKD